MLFQKPANIYFLIAAILQSIPSISPLAPVTAILPLCFVIAVSMLREAVEDYHRHIDDDRVNKSKALVFRAGNWRETLWRDIQVGDLVKVMQNAQIPADILLIDSSNEAGIAHVQTMNLDGETNTKFRKPALEAQDAVNRFMADSSIRPDLAIEADIPRSALDRFDAVLRSGTVTTPLSIENFLPRDATLKSTLWALGLVLYTGKDSKAVLGLLGAKHKVSWVDRATSVIIFIVILLQILMCLIAGALSVYYTTTHGNNMWYLVDALRTPWLEGFQNMLSFFLLLVTMVPISLIVTIEIVKLLQTYLMEADREMIYEYEDNVTGEIVSIGHKCRTSTLNEDLGQVGIVFSDKTGTLTCNSLEFKKCFITGKVYGESDSASSELAEEISRSNNPLSQPVRLGLLTLESQADAVTHFGVALAVCHQVTPDATSSTKIVYAGESPDEVCLVETARQIGFTLLGRDSRSIKVEISSKPVRFEIGHILAFTNHRKRSSVLTRKEGENFYRLYAKGADDVMLPLVANHPASKMYLARAESQLLEYSSAGLRTLIIGMRVIPAAEAEAWIVRVKEAECIINLETRNVQISRLYAELEGSDMWMLGVTATEDKLQEFVPEAISSLREAKIAVWMITGDKLETAIEIARACKLINRSDVFAILDEPDATEKFSAAEGTSLDSVVITGRALEVFFLPERRDRFRALIMRCKTVVCCRTSKDQKAKVVELVREAKGGALTLAIGDGANDVPMIRKAHIGIGVYGREGRQAVQNSDYAISRFYHLERLLLFHGRLNYIRISKVIIFFFFKNVSFTFAQYLFGFDNFWSGSTFYNDYYITCFNLIFTALPVFILGVLELDASPEDSLSKTRHKLLSYPKLYFTGQRNTIFSARNLIFMEIAGFAIGALCYYTSTVGVKLFMDGDAADLWVASQMCYSMVVLVSTGSVLFVTDALTLPLLTTVAFSYLLYLTYVFSSNFDIKSTMTGTAVYLYTDPVFYMWLGLVAFIVFGVMGAGRSVHGRFYPTPKTLWERAARRSRLERRNKNSGVELDVIADSSLC